MTYFSSDFQFLNNSDIIILETKFNEIAHSDEISYEDFKDILNSSNKIINKQILMTFLEKIKKKIRENNQSNSDKELFISNINLFTSLNI